jgi:hypothetical protein
MAAPDMIRPAQGSIAPASVLADKEEDSLDL